jgi:hypothetical protein
LKRPSEQRKEAAAVGASVNKQLAARHRKAQDQEVALRKGAIQGLLRYIIMFIQTFQELLRLDAGDDISLNSLFLDF